MIPHLCWVQWFRQARLAFFMQATASSLPTPELFRRWAWLRCLHYPEFFRSCVWRGLRCWILGWLEPAVGHAIVPPSVVLEPLVLTRVLPLSDPDRFVGCTETKTLLQQFSRGTFCMKSALLAEHYTARFSGGLHRHIRAVPICLGFAAPVLDLLPVTGADSPSLPT